ncbi:MAG: type II toxin-antitoxin system HigB family toxin [Hyphomicrobiales bacterium]|nr:type II toxin-antitoxin system HigB family toxin [Hyphomicrobiales bacterium]
MLYKAVRIIARNTLAAFWGLHPKSKASLERWHGLVKAASWQSMEDVRAAFANAKILNGERVRFEVAGGNFRLIAAFDFERQIVYVKFLGTHAEYDAVDALTVAQF